MTISENDISIIIPTYRYQNKVSRAVRSALASGAGEIIVIDDCSKDGTIEMLAQLNDPRLRIIENPVNLGLWENHLAGLCCATRPWIKFIQADDYLTDGALAQFAHAADDDVSVVWSCPVMEEESTGALTLHIHIAKPWRATTEELFYLCRQIGWVLGRPSDMMIRADCIERDPAVWVTEISSDLVVGILAATRGDIALLPDGNIVNVDHASQDSRTQGSGKGLMRTVQSVEVLRTRLEGIHQQFAAEWAAVSLTLALHTGLAAIYRRQMSPVRVLGLLLRLGALALQAYKNPKSLASVREARKYRHARRDPPDIDALMTEIRQRRYELAKPEAARPRRAD
jgi:hypothetical protein